MNNRRQSLLQGALIGAFFTPTLMTVMFIGERFAQLPNLPFDFFNWVARTLPGSLITFGIDRMVDVLIGLGLGSNLDDAAKTAEQIMALITFWIIGVVAGIVFFAVRNALKVDRDNTIPGIGFGLLVGAPFVLISFAVNVSSPQSPVVQLAWFGLLYAGLGAALQWAWHALSDGSQQQEISKNDNVSVVPLNRRQFLLQVGGASATLTVVGAGLGGLLSATEGEPARNDFISGTALTDSAGNPLPNANDPVQPAPGTRPEYTPVRDHYRIDILSGGLPSIPQDYTLPIFGLVENEVEWTLDEIMEMPSREDFITMSCISNRIGGSLISTTKWTGVSFQEILERVQPSEDAVAMRIIGADNFDEYIPLDMVREDERIMLAYWWDDAPLPLRNGFPLRVHIPDRYGMKQPKWILSIEFVDAHEPGYWVRRGWDAEAIVRATSVIDTVADDAIYEANGQMMVPIGGMAWAGDRDIVSVQVRVDEGEWEDAQLRAPLGERAWTIWRYDWPFSEGTHNFTVRTFEAPPEGQSDPVPQISERAGTRPSGATGYHNLQEIVREPEAETSTEA